MRSDRVYGMDYGIFSIVVTTMLKLLLSLSTLPVYIHSHD